LPNVLFINDSHVFLIADDSACWFILPLPLSVIKVDVEISVLDSSATASFIFLPVA
jgi:hypothetical protein